jgi:hypothetical protein
MNIPKDLTRLPQEHIGNLLHNCRDNARWFSGYHPTGEARAEWPPERLQATVAHFEDGARRVQAEMDARRE